MNKQLEKLCEARNFDEVYRVIESKTIKPSLAYKDISLTKTDLDQLKAFLTQSIMDSLYSGKKIPSSLFKLAELLGEECMASLKAPVCNYMVSQRMADVSQFITLNFRDPGSVKPIFSFIESLVESMVDKYDNIPQGWNADLKLVTRSFVMVKQALCEHFYNNDVSPDSFTRGLLSTISFEKKLDQFFDLKGCCSSIVDFDENEIHVHGKVEHIPCLHRRMLSSVFAPHLEVFYRGLLEPHAKGPVDQSITEKGIVRDFILFFRDLEFVYEKVLHFEDKAVFLSLFETVDQLLLEMVQKVKVQDSVDEGGRVISTLMYVQEVTQEFVHRVSDTFQVDCRSGALEASRKLERAQSMRIERIFNNNLSIIRAGSSNFQSIKTAFEAFLDTEHGVPEEAREFVLEIATSQLFSRIGLIRMNSLTAGLLLSDIAELEQWLGSMFVFVPHIKVIKEYLRIFACPLEPKEGFVKNFRALSNSRFSFHQILKALEDQQVASELFTLYEKTENC